MIIEFASSSPAATEGLAAELSLWARTGQCILLSGELGSGKSTFARAFIRALAGGQQDFDIPSPTFSLLQAYDSTRVPVVHADLYRLRSATEVEELGLGDLLASNVLLIEWPEKLEGGISDEWLRISFSGTGQNRLLKLQAQGSWVTYLERNAVINDFVKQSAFRNGARSFFEGDASARRYESLTADSKSVLLMDMPNRPDGPIVKNNRTYSAIAHLAEGMSAVAAINDYLFGLGYSTAEILDLDLGNGLALMESLGHDVFGKMTAEGRDMRKPMRAAIEVLADMAGRVWPRSVPLRGGSTYHLSEYDSDALSIEIDLLLSWYWPHIKRDNPSAAAAEEFAATWRGLMARVEVEKPVWTLRDFHSPNLLWMPERSGLRRVGLIDTQDCVLGHPAYDVVSLLQDARVDVEFEFADELFGYYCDLRTAAGPFDAKGFAQAFAILGAQRATKILGIFARLSKRDGKHLYLKHMPRVSRYLLRNLQHPDLAGLRMWYEKHFPSLWDGARK